MSQATARDVSWDLAPVESGRYDMSLPFANGPTPNTLVRKIARSYKAGRGVYSPSITNLTSWTNLIPWSQAFTNAVWGVAMATVADNVYLAPDGTQTAAQVLETAATGFHSFAEQNYTATGATINLSCFYAPKGRQFVTIGFIDFASVTRRVMFDIVNGLVISTANGAIGAIQKMSDGSFRCSVTITPAAGVGLTVCNMSPDGSTLSYLGVASLGVSQWGFQILAGSNPGPYVPTTSAARLRNSCSRTGAAIA